MIVKAIDLIINSPIYPHWLMNKKTKEGNDEILKYIYGNILEVGAGDGHMKKYMMDNFLKVKSYTATDCSEYLINHSEIGKVIEEEEKAVIRHPSESKNIDNNFLTKAKSLFFKYKNLFLAYKEKIPLDNDCDACSLPYPNESYDCHISFETLEHINNPFKYFEEATRVVKRDGLILVTVPFLFRMHGGEPDHKGDFFRYTYGYFYEISERNNLEIVHLYNNTGFGTTFAQMANQWLIMRIKEGSLILKIFLVLICPIVFLINNLVGLATDIKPDKRFATRWHVVMRKKS